MVQTIQYQKYHKKKKKFQALFYTQLFIESVPYIFYSLALTKPFLTVLCYSQKTLDYSVEYELRWTLLSHWLNAKGWCHLTLDLWNDFSFNKTHTQLKLNQDAGWIWLHFALTPSGAVCTKRCNVRSGLAVIQYLQSNNTASFCFSLSFLPCCNQTSSRSNSSLLFDILLLRFSHRFGEDCVLRSLWPPLKNRV